MFELIDFTQKYIYKHFGVCLKVHIHICIYYVYMYTHEAGHFCKFKMKTTWTSFAENHYILKISYIAVI